MKAILFITVSFLTVSWHASAASLPAIHPEVDKIIEPFVKSDKFSGVVLVQGPEGIIHLKSYGMAVREHSVPNKVESVFRIGSLSKQFTAALVLHLQERGILSVEDPLTKFFEIPKQWEGIKIHHLLTHTSGMAHDFPFSHKDHAAYHSPDELLAAAVDMPLLHSEGPGKRYSYSNVGYTTLAIIVEKALLRAEIKEKSYPDLFEKVFTQNLSLAQTGVDHQSLVTPNMTTGYIRVGEAVSKECCLDILNLLGAGEIRSSALDLSKWLDILLQNRFLNESSRQQLWEPKVQMEYEGKLLPDLFYGYGWVVLNKAGRQAILHNGSVPGFDADVTLWPNEQRRIIVLSNVRFIAKGESTPAAISSEIRDQIDTLLFSKQQWSKAEKQALKTIQ